MSEHEIIQQALTLLIDKERRNNDKLQQRVADLEQENHRLELKLKEVRHVRMQTQEQSDHVPSMRGVTKTVGKRDFTIREGETPIDAFRRVHGASDKTDAWKFYS